MYEPQQPLAPLETSGELKRREMRAQERAEQFRILAEALPDLVWSFDASGKCMYANKRWTDYTGRALDELTGHGWISSLHPEDRDLTLQTWSKAVEDESVFFIEHRIRGLNNEHRWFKTRGTPVRDGDDNIAYWVGTCIDIDEQRRISEVLEERVRQRTAELQMLKMSVALNTVTGSHGAYSRVAP